MKIIIVGCGKVGLTIAKYLSAEDNDLVLIDKKVDAFGKIVESVDSMVIRGNGLSAKTLDEAGVKTSDLIISVTNSDETNILCCLTAKKLGVSYAVARVRDPEYALELSRFKKDLGIDMIINPEQQAGLEISRLLRFPSADGVETFVGGRVELVSFRVMQEHNLSGKKVYQIFEKARAEVLLATVERNGEAIIPRGNFMLANDDIIRVLGKPSEVTEFFKSIGINVEKIKDVMIIGGGKITYYLTEYLSRYSTKIKIVEIDDDKCDKLSEDLPKCIIIKGDGTDEDLLSSENFSDAGAVICLTDRDEENVVVALYAKNIGVSKIIIKINHINVNLVKNLGLGSVICPKNITAYQIIRFVRGLSNSYHSSDIKTLYKIIDIPNSGIEALEFDVSSTSKCLNIPLKDLQLKEGILIGCIVRSGNIIIPTGVSSIHDGDTVIIFSSCESLSEFDGILS